MPKVSGPTGAAGADLRHGAPQQAASPRPRTRPSSLKDDFISVEHFLLAAADDRRRRGKHFKELGITRDRLMQALREVRGNQRVTTQNPEATYEALEKYGRDLTQTGRAGQARSGDRPRRGDPPRHPGALAPHQEQPGADRRARRRQDRHRGRAGAAHRARRRAGGPQREAHRVARHGRADRRRQVPRRVRRAAQGRAEGGPGIGRARSSSSSTNCTRWSARARPKAPWTRATC